MSRQATTKAEAQFRRNLKAETARSLPQLLLGEDQRNKKTYHFSLADWKTNLHVIGPPGSGKTFLLYLLAVQLILMGQTVIVLDPLGPLAEKIFRWLSFQGPRIQDRVMVRCYSPTAAGSICSRQ